MQNSNDQPYSKPAAIFEKVKRDFITAVEGDSELREPLYRLRKFKGVFNTPEDAKRLVELKKRGANKLDINVGTLPLEIGPGLAFMYDVVLEAIRLEPERIKPKMFKRRAFRTVENLFDDWLLNIGACSVTALERALKDDEYAERLRQRGRELGWIALDQRPPPDICPFCTLFIRDKDGNITDIACPTEEQCNDILWIIIILLLLWLTYKIIKWLWD